MTTTKKLLEEELLNYTNGSSELSHYYPNMNILVSNLYKKQLQEVIQTIEEKDDKQAKSFKLYLDTIIINMHTKVEKYKQSIYFENVNIKDIENQGYTIPFYIDDAKDIFVLLGLVKSV